MLATVLSLFMAALSWFTAVFSTTHELERRLGRILPPAVDQALINGDDRDAAMEHIRRRLEQYLNPLPSATGWAAAECAVSVDYLGTAADSASDHADFDIRWRHQNQPLQASLSLHCSPRALPLALRGLGLGVLTLAALLWLPAPLTRKQRFWRQKLMEEGLPRRQAARLVAPLRSGFNAAQAHLLETLVKEVDRPFETLRDWALMPQSADLPANRHAAFLLALRRLDYDPVAAHASARSEDHLHVDLANGQVRVRGIAIPLPRTPLLYYAWYALRRRDGDGWLLNPPSNRPDREQGEQLARFMQTQQGHPKAINDLLDHGLRAKTLDQNRNRIKEELVAVLGEALAAPYLFVSERHGAQARSRYRLTLPPTAVTVDLISTTDAEPA
ncbi:hypothetical protein B5T_02933 [Alloalcanivorax dieselolei B5]|uniref:Uncharacterized protein n=1 Tax=Alcanivorax dieselolei (strain DSM 16502 / CGMCC 1.3690 / MCCC 1A00001 / B-5) TaxID=930169 RepID=K0CHY7_ALCDB|nr:hypothetical protein B5T_02933 [Alloalcanivorax dieselolei B5]